MYDEDFEHSFSEGEAHVALVRSLCDGFERWLHGAPDGEYVKRSGSWHHNPVTLQKWTVASDVNGNPIDFYDDRSIGMTVPGKTWLLGRSKQSYRHFPLIADRIPSCIMEVRNSMRAASYAIEAPSILESQELINNERYNR